MDAGRYDKRQLTAESTDRRRWAAALFAAVLLAATGSILGLLLPITPVPLILTRVAFTSLPGWQTGNAAVALAAFRRSCTGLLRLPPDKPMGGAGYAGTAGDWRSACKAISTQPGEATARKWFELTFAPFAVSAKPDRTAVFTGYYEPEIRASRTRHGNYATPIYGTPRDLITANLGVFRRDLAGIRVSGHVVQQQFVPFPARAEIDSAGLGDAEVLLYANDPIGVFFLHIQGSGRARLDDGSMLRLAYAGQNGRPYTPIGRALIAKGDIDREHMSMQAIRIWLANHARNARALMESDESYVFFRELPIGDPRLGSPGTEGVPLTPEASIAVDPAFHALGIPMYVVAQAPADDAHGQSFRFAHLCVAQDTGGAIKGGARADIFWGFGARAESIAGRMKSGGNLYVLLPNSLAARIGPSFQAR